MSNPNNLRGSEWKKWDLHIHTPASYDWAGGDVSSDELILKAKENDIKVLAITDHHSVTWIDQMRSSGKKHGIVVLPGVELRTDKGNKGIHLIGIFPDETPSKALYDRVLSPLGFSETDIQQKGNRSIYCNFEDACEKIHDLNGMVFIHAGKKSNGLEQIDSDINSLLKRDIAKLVDCLEVTNEDQVNSYKNIVFPDVKREWPIIITSDSVPRSNEKGHTKDNIGGKFTWIKANPSYDGLRQIIYFPWDRVRYSIEPPQYSYPRIKKISLQNHKDGHCLSALKDDVLFSDNLTAIIGHPSIGKSTFTDILGYAFGLDDIVLKSESASSKVDNIGKINSDLCIKVEYSVGNVTNHMVRDITGNYVGGDMSPSEAKITYLNQGFIDRTARDQKEVSNIIDKIMDTSEIETLWQDIEKEKTELKMLRDKYINRYKLINHQNIVQGEIAELRKFFDLSESDAYKQLQKDREDIRTTKAEAINIQQRLRTLITLLTDVEEKINLNVINISKLFEVFPSTKGASVPDIVLQIHEMLEGIKTLLQKIENAKEHSDLKKREDDLIKQTQTLLGSEGLGDFSKILIQDKEKSLEIKLEQEQKIQRQISECDLAMENFDKKITSLTHLYEKWEAVNNSIISSFNSDLDNIEVRYQTPDDRRWLINILVDEVKNAWQEYSDVESEPKKFIRPSTTDIESFLDLVKQEKGCNDHELKSYFLECLKDNVIPLNSNLEFVQWLFGGRSEVIKSFLLMRLQEFYEKGDLQIFYKGKNISKDGLSYTERCGALLEVILQKGNHPIIMDQPEENLGSSYITSIFINNLLKAKTKRQIIVISHNANTVVLADSELIVCFDRVQDEDSIKFTSGAIESKGMKELICNIIEGGIIAFETRAKRYALGLY